MEILLVILFVVIVFTVIQLIRNSTSGPENKESGPDNNISFQKEEKKNSNQLEEVDY